MHRDIKTENILLSGDGVVKIGDLGLACKMIDPIMAAFRPQQYTLNVVTLWYRAPEILLGDRRYTSQIDLWSVGCIMAEFWKRHAIMQGTNEYHQLELISKLCGTIDAKAWPNVVDLKHFQTIKVPGPYERCTLKYLNNVLPDVNANNFFDSLMRYDPEKRLNAWTALNDEFFYLEPLPLENLKQFVERITPLMKDRLIPPTIGQFK